MDEIDDIMTNIDELIDGLNHIESNETDTSELISKLEEEKGELKMAKQEPKPTQRSIITVSKQNIIHILVELNDESFSALLDVSDISSSFEHQIRSS